MSLALIALGGAVLSPPGSTVGGTRGAKMSNYNSTLQHWIDAAVVYEAWLSNAGQSVLLDESLEFMETGTWTGFDSRFVTITNLMRDQLAVRPNSRFRIGIPTVHDHTQWDALLAGTYDSHFTAINDQLVALDVAVPGTAARFALRINWEMNGSWFGWGVRPLGGTWPTSTWTAAKSRAGWRRAAGLMAGCRALGTRLVWNPALPFKSISWGSLWCGNDDAGVDIPGFNLCDVVGMDCYDQFTGGTSATPQARWAAMYSASNGISTFLSNNITRFGNLPVSFDEWGVATSFNASTGVIDASSSNAGDDPYFITQMASVMQTLVNQGKFDGQCYWEDTSGIRCRLATNTTWGAMEAPLCGAAFKNIWGGP